jgi:hypothetical protein
VSRIIKGATSRSLLKLAIAAGYGIVMMTGLFGLSSSRGQELAPLDLTPTATPTTVGSSLTVSPDVVKFDVTVVLPPDGALSKPTNVILSVAKGEPQSVIVEQPLMVSDPAAPPAQFIIQPNNCTVIAPGTSCSVPIVFQPNGARKRSAILLVTSNAANGVQSVQLLGGGKVGKISIAPGSLSFPVANVGALPTSSKSVTITNKNPVQLTIHGITSSNPGVFPITDGCPGVLQPNANCTVSASFMADRNGLIRGSIIVSDNAAKSMQKVHLAGSGRGGPTVTRTATATRTPTPTATRSPSAPFPMRAYPAIS